MATAKALFPRWCAFIQTGLLAGLRWGESAALYRGDIDWRRSRIHVQRTWCDKTGQIDAPKDSEGYRNRNSEISVTSAAPAKSSPGEFLSGQIILEPVSPAPLATGFHVNPGYERFRSSAHVHRVDRAFGALGCRPLLHRLTNRTGELR